MILLLLAPVIAIALVGGAALALRVQGGSQRRLIGSVLEDGAPDQPSVANDASLLYFTGVHCTVCHVAQRPALLALEQRLGPSLRVREIDVADDPALARKYRVLSLPTTIVLRADHSIASVNTGFTAADVLERQLVDAGLQLPQLAGA
jgi:hypothetical protein